MPLLEEMLRSSSLLKKSFDILRRLEGLTIGRMRSKSHGSFEAVPARQEKEEKEE
jgi:hypothetical protein